MDYTTIIGTTIAGLIGTNAWSFYKLRHRTRAEAFKHKDEQLAQWREDLRERTKHLEEQVDHLLEQNAELLAKVELLQTELHQLRVKYGEA